MFRAIISLKQAASVSVGELITIGYRGETTLAIVYGVENGALTMLLLQPFRGEAAFRSKVLRVPLVASFGTGWVLEPVDYVNASLDSPSVAAETLGLVYLRSDGPVIQGVGGEFMDAFHLNINNHQVVTTYYAETIQVPSWQLWASEAHRTELRATPLLVFKAGGSQERVADRA